jgi:HAMP domain-containing protein
MTTENLPAIAPRLDRLIKRRQEVGMPEPGPVDMGVLQTILLDEIAGRLDELQEVAIAIGRLVQKQESQMDKAPVGVMRPFTKTITGDTIVEWRVYEDVGQNCTSATVYSDGPDDCYICLNDLRNGFQKLEANENLSFDFHGHPLIATFFFKSVVGGSCSLRIPLEY